MPRTPLTTLTTVALAGCGLMFLVGMVLAGGLEELDLLAPAVLLFGSAALAASRLRWGPLPGSLISFAITVMGPFFQDYSRYHLTHPEQFSFFAFTLLLHALGVVATVAGLTAVWHRYRGRSQDTQLPRWVSFGITALVGAVAGAIALAATLAAVGTATAGTAPPAASDRAAIAARFAVEDMAFTQAPERIDAGDIAIVLRNDGALHHDIAIDGVDGANPVTEATPGATTTGQVRLRPGTFTYFCSVPGHREAGMEGELRVD